MKIDLTDKKTRYVAISIIQVLVGFCLLAVPASKPITYIIIGLGSAFCIIAGMRNLLIDMTFDKHVDVILKSKDQLEKILKDNDELQGTCKTILGSFDKQVAIIKREIAGCEYSTKYHMKNLDLAVAAHYGGRVYELKKFLKAIELKNDK